ncbi:MAG: hypothetical protein HY922_08120 [Elusimicrobia bacterium]|nr:hypothetical protein [Elusimicrobiota bacterium]
MNAQPSRYDEADFATKYSFHGEMSGYNYSEKYFRPIGNIMLRTFNPFKGAGSYDLNLQARFFEFQKDSGYVPIRTTFLLSMCTGIATHAGQKSHIGFSEDLFSMPVRPTGETPCSSCQGTGCGRPAKPGEMAVPDQVLAMHDELAAALDAGDFPTMREDQSFTVGSNFDGMWDPAIYQIMFQGRVLGFGAKSPSDLALVHYPAVWNCTLNIKPEEIVRMKDDPKVAAALCAFCSHIYYTWYDYDKDPSIQHLPCGDSPIYLEAARNPWHLPCERCHGRGKKNRAQCR